MIPVMIKNISKVNHDPSMLEVPSKSKPRKANTCKSKPVRPEQIKDHKSRAKASILHTFTSKGDVSIQVKNTCILKRGPWATSLT